MIAAIIAAAGVGKRMGHHIPKPYLQLAGKPILAHTLKIFEAMPEIREVTVVVHPEDLDLCQDTVIAPYPPEESAAAGTRGQRTARQRLSRPQGLEKRG